MPQDCYECVLSIEYALVILEINSDEIQVVLEATRLAILTEERDESPISFNEWRSEQSLMALFGCTAYYAWRSVGPSTGPSRGVFDGASGAASGALFVGAQTPLGHKNVIK